MLKKFLICFLSIAILALSAGCGSSSYEQPAHPDTSGIKKILFLGNSHAKDTCFALPEIFKAEGYTDYTFGLAYIGGKSLADHATYVTKDWDTYVYYLSVNCGNYTTPNGKTDDDYNLATFGSILQDQTWDLVILQICMGDIFKDDNGDAKSRKTLVDYIHSILPDAKIGTSCSWLSPYADDESTMNRPAQWEQRMEIYNRYGTTDAEHFAPQCKVMKGYILNDPTYYISFSVGTSVYYANKVLGVPSGNVNYDATVLYRDDVHMTIFGRAMISYAFFAQFIGQKLTEVRLDAVSVDVANGAYYDKYNIPALTEEQKNVIIDTANYTFDHPWEVPAA